MRLRNPGRGRSEDRGFRRQPLTRGAEGCTSGSISIRDGASSSPRGTVRSSSKSRSSSRSFAAGCSSTASSPASPASPRELVGNRWTVTATARRSPRVVALAREAGLTIGPSRDSADRVSDVGDDQRGVTSGRLGGRRRRGSCRSRLRPYVRHDCQRDRPSSSLTSSKGIIRSRIALVVPLAFTSSRNSW